MSIPKVRLGKLVFYTLHLPKLDSVVPGQQNKNKADDHTKGHVGYCGTLATMVTSNLEEFVLESHVRFGLQANACTEDIGQGIALLGKSIDNRRARGRQWSLLRLAVAVKGRIHHTP